MRIESKLQNKLLLLFAGFGTLAVLLIGIYAYNVGRNALMHRTFEQLIATREAKTENLKDFFDNKLESSKIAASSINMTDVKTQLRENPNQVIQDKVLNLFMLGGDYRAMFVVYDEYNYAFGRFDGSKLHFTNDLPSRLIVHLRKALEETNRTKEPVVLDYVETQGQYFLTFVAPSFDEYGMYECAIGLTVASKELDKILQTFASSGLGSTGETYVVGNDRLMRSSSRFRVNSIKRTKVETKAVTEGLKGKRDTQLIPDYRNTNVLSSYGPFPYFQLDWAIVSQIDEKETLNPVHSLRNELLIFGIIVIFLFWFTVTITSKQVSKPLVKLMSITESIGSGDYGMTSEVTTKDEIGQLTSAFNQMSIRILKQRMELEERNREILDSISYAKRIQTAILPSDKLIDNLLMENFVIFLPKHKVSGDFYYITKEKKSIHLAVADCTGHGVPGAFVTGIGIAAFQRSIKGSGLMEPAEILNNVNNIVAETFSSSELNIREGMDAGLCCIDFQEKVLQFSGANLSLYFVRDGKLHQVKGDRQPIGNNERRTPFSNHIVPIQKGDCFYLFTDGYKDQFGGPKQKKFMTARLKDMLLEIHTLSMVEQKYKLLTAHDEWKNGEEQVDDICFLGFRF